MKKQVVRREKLLWGVIVGLLIWVGWLTMKNNYAPRIYMITGGEGGGGTVATPKPSPVSGSGTSMSLNKCREFCDSVKIPRTSSWRERLDNWTLRTYCKQDCQDGKRPWLFEEDAKEAGESIVQSTDIEANKKRGTKNYNSEMINFGASGPVDVYEFGANFAEVGQKIHDCYCNRYLW